MGIAVGGWVGTLVGLRLGRWVGSFVGLCDGARVWRFGRRVGWRVRMGLRVGLRVRLRVGGFICGRRVGVRVIILIVLAGFWSWRPAGGVAAASSGRSIDDDVDGRCGWSFASVPRRRRLPRWTGSCRRRGVRSMESV